MSYQNPLTLVTPIELDPDKQLYPKKNNINELYDRLSGLKYALEKGSASLIDNSHTVHYLRWLIIDDDITENDHTIFFKKGTGRKPQLVFSSNFDGTVDKHLTDLCDRGNKEGKLIDQIYECCVDYPDKNERTPETRKAYLKKYEVKASAFYRGSPKRSLKQIRDENKLRLRLRELLDKGNWAGLSFKEMHSNLKGQIGDEKEYNWTKEKFKMPKKNYFKLALLILTILILLPVIIVWLLIVQYGYEKKDTYFTGYRSDIDPEKIKVLEEYEDLTSGEEISDEIKDKTLHKQKDLTEEENQKLKDKNKIIFYQNQFSQLVEMKPGKVRLITFKAMMLFARVLIPIKFVDGELMNIPTIHFARWVLFDDNKRVLFFSNFDGSWQQYLGDFIDQSGWGLSAIFANTTNFPKTNWLGITGLLAPKTYPRSGMFFPGGAYDEERFLAWSRDTELSTQIWYTAYPELSIKNVNNNSIIRVMLAKNLSEKKAKKFFQLI